MARITVCSTAVGIEQLNTGKELKALKATNNFLVSLNLISKKLCFFQRQFAKYLLLNQCSSVSIAQSFLPLNRLQPENRLDVLKYLFVRLVFISGRV